MNTHQWQIYRQLSPAQHTLYVSRVGVLVLRTEETTCIIRPPRYSGSLHTQSGYYLAAESLPVTRFFCTLNNDLPEMKAEQSAAIAEGRTAFVITRGMGGSQRQRSGGSQKESIDMSAYRAVDTCAMFFEGAEWSYTLYERIDQ